MKSLLSSIVVSFCLLAISQNLYSQTGTVTDIDGNVYQTVQIGSQLWMAENLKVTHYRNGEAIPNVIDNGIWAGLATGAYCSYNNDNGNKDTYGLLYNWYAVDDNRNIAPAGWHVPSEEEWMQLEMHLGMSQSEVNDIRWRGSNEGGKMKETGTIHWGGSNEGATNSSGFSALPGGYRYFNDGTFGMLRNYAYFWSATKTMKNLVWFRSLSFMGPAVRRNTYDKQCGFSVRLVRD